MKETMGQIIRRLRGERGFTQEELAEQIGVTYQAVSKWENDTGMPDISQVVPLATVFDVSTDVLFGLYGTNNREEVMKIIEEAESYISYPTSKDMLKKKYDCLHAGLKVYPNNTTLLMNCLEVGISLAYPSNDVYDPENGEAIFERCIPEADLVIKYGKNVTDILRARMIMVLLQAAYGNYEAARIHAEEFPWRADMTAHKMYGYIARWEMDYAEESKCWQTDFMYHFEAILDDMTNIAICALKSGDYDSAIECLNQALSFISLICKDEIVAPRFHIREAGDIHFLLATAYLKQNKKEKAFVELNKMVECDTDETMEFVSGEKLKTSFLRDVDFDFYWNCADFKEVLQKKLNDPALDEIRDSEEFCNLLKKAKME